MGEITMESLACFFFFHIFLSFIVRCYIFCTTSFCSISLSYIFLFYIFFFLHLSFLHFFYIFPTSFFCPTFFCPTSLPYIFLPHIFTLFLPDIFTLHLSGRHLPQVMLKQIIFSFTVEWVEAKYVGVLILISGVYALTWAYSKYPPRQTLL